MSSTSQCRARRAAAGVAPWAMRFGALIARIVRFPLSFTLLDLWCEWFVVDMAFDTNFVTHTVGLPPFKPGEEVTILNNVAQF